MSGDMPMPMPMDNMDMMAMTFYWGKNAVVLFKDWPGHSLGMYILSLFFVFFLSFGVEILSLFQAAKPSRLAGVVFHTAVYALKTTLAYLVMLAVMSFNIGILIAAVLGHALGFLIVKFLAMSRTSRAETLVAETEPKV